MREGLSAEERVCEREEQQRNTWGCVIVQAKKLGWGVEVVKIGVLHTCRLYYIIIWHWFPLVHQRHSFASRAEVNLNHIGLGDPVYFPSKDRKKVSVFLELTGNLIFPFCTSYFFLWQEEQSNSPGRGPLVIALRPHRMPDFPQHFIKMQQ